MKETGIIMSGNHPKLILDKLKTMTRRTYGLEKVNDMPYLWEKPFYSEEYQRWGFWQKNTGDVIYLKCPYGQVGDRLWVRETFCEPTTGRIIYKVDETPYEISSDGSGLYSYHTWKPSIHMPRWASRIILEITAIRVERVQEIELVDVEDEGIIIPNELLALPDHKGKYLAILQLFIDLWDSLNAKRGLGWDFNPWVWPISFKV